MPPADTHKATLSDDECVASNQAAWNLAAQKYQGDIQRDVAFLRSGGVILKPVERRILGDLSGVNRAIHLQCSHGLDALSLLNLGVNEVVGVDISRAMLDQAESKTKALGAAAVWVESEVLSTPTSLDATADLVYTGQGAIPWVSDLDRWARVVSRLLRPGGRFFLYEGHPLNWIWSKESASHTLRKDGRSYFDQGAPKPNDGFPASAVKRFTPEGKPIPASWEWQWTLGQVLTALASAGLHIDSVEEHAEQFWDQFPDIAHHELEKLPHTYSVLATR